MAFPLETVERAGALRSGWSPGTDRQRRGVPVLPVACGLVLGCLWVHLPALTQGTPETALQGTEGSGEERGQLGGSARGHLSCGRLDSLSFPTAMQVDISQVGPLTSEHVAGALPSLRPSAPSHLPEERGTVFLVTDGTGTLQGAACVKARHGTRLALYM